MKKAGDYDDAHLRVFDRVKPAADLAAGTVHLVGICGTGMGSLAGLFRAAGFTVRGSDANAWPPMSTRLRDSGIDVIEGYRPENLDPVPDVVVVGNACTPTHPEAERARDEGLPQLSFPEAFAEYFIGSRRSLVVAGTHGKTTTSGLLAHTLVVAGLDPTFLVGGVLKNGDSSFRLGGGNVVVVEGDEYDSAYFDKRPKFMHYRPTSAIVTSMEYDHADIYEDWTDYRSAFEDFAATISPDGVLVLNADDPAVVALATRTRARVVTYGLTDDPDVTAAGVDVGPHGIAFRLDFPDGSSEEITLPVTGRHNLSNALAVAALSWTEGVPIARIREAFATFAGLKRRQEIIGEHAGVLVIDDFAHHPTAVHVTVDGVRARWPNRRLVAVFEPRSNSSRRRVFEGPYAEAFAGARVAVISAPPFRHNDRADDFMDVSRICEDLNQRGIEAHAAPDNASVRELLEATARPGDIVLIMSNGGFGGLHGWLLDHLRSR